MWWEILGLPGLGDSISTDPERTALRRQGEEPGSIEVLQQRAGRLNVKRLFLKKTRYLKGRNLVLVYGWGKSLGSQKHSSDTHSANWGQQSQFWASSELTTGSGCGLTAAQQTADVLPEFPQAHSSHLWGLRLLVTVTSLFTYMTGNTLFLTFYLSSFLGRTTWLVGS